MGSPGLEAPRRPRSIVWKQLLDELLKPFSPGLRARAREPLFLEMLHHGLRGEVTLVEVGSSDGCEAIEALRYCGAPRVVIAEPHAGSIATAEAAFRAARVPRQKISLHQVAVGDHSGPGTIFVHPTHPNLNSAHAPPPGATQQATRFTTISDLLAVENITGPALIKMDVEGYEVEVIAGAMSAIEAGQDLRFLLEVHPERYSESHSLANIMERLFALGYRVTLLEFAGQRAPAEFLAAGMSPVVVGRRRALYADPAPDVAMRFCCFQHRGQGGHDRKIARSVLLMRP